MSFADRIFGRITDRPKPAWEIGIEEDPARVAAVLLHFELSGVVASVWESDDPVVVEERTVGEETRTFRRPRTLLYFRRPPGHGVRRRLLPISNEKWHQWAVALDEEGLGMQTDRMTNHD